MRFSLALVASALATFAAAQTKGNAFNIPPAGYLLEAGQPTTFTWSNQQGPTVTIKLRDGANGDLNEGETIASSITNDGSFTFNVPADTVEGNSYTLEIINDAEPSQTNFTPQFVIQSPNKAVPSSASASRSASASATTEASSTEASSTEASSTDASSTESATTATATTSTGTASTRATRSTTGTASESSRTASASETDSESATASTTRSGSATAASSVPTDNPAPVVKVGGSLLMVAIGFAVAF